MKKAAKTLSVAITITVAALISNAISAQELLKPKCDQFDLVLFKALFPDRTDAELKSWWEKACRESKLDVDHEKAYLWVKDYKSLPVIIESVADNRLGLTDDTIRTKTELRLRQAGIRPLKPFENNLDYWLAVSVDLTPGAFLAHTHFSRSARWTLPNDAVHDAMITVWTDSSFGTHGQKADFVVNSLDQILDRFLNQYLKANQ